MTDETSRELFYRVAMRNKITENLKDGWLRDYHLKILEEDFIELITYLAKTSQYDILNQIKNNIFNKDSDE